MSECILITGAMGGIDTAAGLAPHGIGVFEVRPGIIRTSMIERVSEKYDRLIADRLIPAGRGGFPDDMAAAIAMLWNPDQFCDRDHDRCRRRPVNSQILVSRTIRRQMTGASVDGFPVTEVGLVHLVGAYHPPGEFAARLDSDGGRRRNQVVDLDPFVDRGLSPIRNSDYSTC